MQHRDHSQTPLEDTGYVYSSVASLAFQLYHLRFCIHTTINYSQLSIELIPEGYLRQLTTRLY